MLLPFLDAALWADAKPFILMSLYNGFEPVSNLKTPATMLYAPKKEVPTATCVRISQSSKRLEGTLQAKVVAEGTWGKQYEVGQGNNVVGYAWMWAPIFSHGHTLPDIVHLINKVDPQNQQTPSLVFDTKGLKLVTIVDGDAVDIMLTTKQRFFRARNNPKSLGFAKEER